MFMINVRSPPEIDCSHILICILTHAGDFGILKLEHDSLPTHGPLMLNPKGEAANILVVSVNCSGIPFSVLIRETLMRALNNTGVDWERQIEGDGPAAAHNDSAKPLTSDGMKQRCFLLCSCSEKGKGDDGMGEEQRLFGPRGNRCFSGCGLAQFPLSMACFNCLIEIEAFPFRSVFSALPSSGELNTKLIMMLSCKQLNEKFICCSDWGPSNLSQFSRFHDS